MSLKDAEHKHQATSELAVGCSEVICETAIWESACLFWGILYMFLWSCVDSDVSTEPVI